MLETDRCNVSVGMATGPLEVGYDNTISVLALHFRLLLVPIGNGIPNSTRIPNLFKNLKNIYTFYIKKYYECFYLVVNGNFQKEKKKKNKSNRRLSH